ncbi:MAG: hypothetical protein ACRDV6_10315 [Acidimicrobiales bacterium]
MSRFTDIELTSRAPDGSWTWRAAGARQPRGTVSADLVPSDGRVGDVVRAELESALDGVEVISVAAAKAIRRDDDRAKRIEVLGAPRSEPGVSISLARGTRLRDRDGDRDRDRRPRRDGGTGPRRDDRPPRDDRPRRDDRPGRDDRPRRDDRPGRTADGRPRRDDERREGRPAGAAAAAADGESRGRPDRAGPRRDPRPTVSAVHRNAALASLRPEQLPVAEQLVRGGIPAVRQAIDEQNKAAKAAGQPPAAAEALLAMAEELLPVVNLAGWKDRAVAAQGAGRSMRLRELRAVVAASRTVSLDDEAKTLAKSLQDSLNERVTHLRDEWEKRIGGALDSGNVLDALQVSARPPEASTRCPAELAVRLAQAAGAAMTAETTVEDWLALLGAVLESPVRRTVKPVGLPDTDETRSSARKAAGLVPALARLIGLPIPPPPPRRPPPPPRRPLSPVSGGGSTGAP